MMMITTVIIMRMMITIMIMMIIILIRIIMNFLNVCTSSVSKQSKTVTPSHY